YGTALGVIRAGASTGKIREVFAGETRPWLQGARLTAWELLRDSIPAHLIGDSAAAHLMSTGQVQWVVVGADRIAANRHMGELGARLLGHGVGVLTHCNTGSLATAGYGTALGVIRAGYSDGSIARVFAGETRPWLQGARLTMWELHRDGIPAHLIADSAAAHLMKSGDVQWVVVGADRIAANGDTANKIGTYQLAIAAKHHGVKVMVVAPSSTIDMATVDGAAIEIELRSPDEMLSFGGKPTVVAGAKAWNPVFDVTPHDLIDVLVTERGVVERPDAERMKALFGAKPAAA
ncbi:MAG TPA: S-methyl-5-thioribose-1-phosphate isomerase, partial [Rhodanobacteraceae bacterium]